MSSRRVLRDPRWRGSELEVKEVIMPVKNDQEGAEQSVNVSKDQKVYKCIQNITHSTLKLEDQKISTFYELVALNKPPPEDFVLGTRKKKCKKKKTKYNQHHLKNNSTLRDWFLGTNETFHSENEIVNDSSSKETYEEKQELEQKIKNYEKLMMQQQQNNYRRQRHLEQHALEQQENLAETWLRFFQRRKELRKENLEENVSSISHPVYKRQHYTSPINISLASKKYWNDETSEKTSPLNRSKKSLEPMKKKEEEKAQKPLPVVLEVLKDEFFEKLVFVDDSDGISD